MIETLLNLVKNVLAILPFVLLCLAGVKVNLSKTERSRQVLMPAVALVYVIVAMLLLNNINEWLLQLLDNIPKWIAALADVSWMPEAVGNVLVQVADFIRELLKKLELSYWIFFISNTVLITVYLLLKKIALGIMQKAIKTDGVLHEKISGVFYEFFSERNSWCVREPYAQARNFLRVFYYTALVLSSLLMLVSRHFYQDGLFESVFYPVFGVVVMGEVYFYLDGLTRREYTNDVLGEDEEAYRTVNYSLLRKFLRSLFGDKLLTENTSVNNALAYDVTTDQILRELEKREDTKVASFAAYYSGLNAAGMSIDHNYLYSSLDMLEGKSVLFNNPFYNDLIPYAFYPMNRTLLSHRKVLVVLGRHAIEEDIRGWLERGVEAVTNIPFLWNIGILNDESQEVDIGIVTRSAVLDAQVHEANAAFLEQVGFMVILEPSKLISTAQIGLNMLVKKCLDGEEDKQLVYCLCDKNCDGLVDAMSHILMTNLTEVAATQKHLGTSSYMCWEPDGEYLHHRLLPNISRYLGVGTELSFAALKNQVSKTTWYGGEAFPVTDMHWIAKQYYYDLTRYAGLPTSQEALDEHFETSPNFWSAEAEQHKYLTVEDEACNMFEILRDFSTRTTEQGFINVISSDYLLKEYMADNASIFETDAKAIPHIVADFTRSNRNTVLRMILMMSTYPVSGEVLEKELSLLGIRVYDLKKQLWYEIFRCYAPLSQVEAMGLPESYEEAVEAVYAATLPGLEVGADVLTVAESFNLRRGVMEITYSITDKPFLAMCVTELQSAGYVSEDEKGERYFLGAELCGHIYQRYLPGQFFTFGGKYYEMQHLTADGQVLVRRAADHIGGRPSYRQLRRYTVAGVRSSDRIGAQRDVAGMKVVREFADITVDTPGYYRMEQYGDFATARKVLFEGEKNGIPQRVYRNKEILRIELPETEGKLTDSVRYTVAVLFNEVFRTLFAENQAFVSAVTDCSFMEGADGPLTYCLEGDAIHPNAIYVIEDSQLDMGLTVAVERNLERIFHIVQDFLAWHAGKLEESLNPPPEPTPPIIFTDPSADKPPKKGLKKLLGAIGGFFKKIGSIIKGWFKRKPKKPKPEPVPEEEPVIPDPPAPEPEPVVPEPPVPEEEPLPAPEPVPEEEPILPEIPTDDGGAGDGDFVKEPAEMTESPVSVELTTADGGTPALNGGIFAPRKPYHERHYLRFGSENESPYVDPTGALAYLTALGMDRNPLKQARLGKNIADVVEATFKPGRPDARYCDFCGAEIYGVEYETLADGRDRCLNCSRTAVKTGEEFRKIFEDVKRNMESFYGIRIDTGIKVEMVNAKTLHKRLGEAFIPTPKSDGRVLGVAIKDKNGYTILVENGSPRMASMLTLAHELTHIWQYLNWNDKHIRKKYGRKMRLEIYEGMAKWVEIQYAYLINEPATAKREDIITSHREDAYGYGFLRYKANYPFSLGTVITKPTPFMDVETPLDPEFCGPFTMAPPPAETPTGGDGLPPAGILPPEPIKGPIHRNPSAVYHYAYERLSEAEKTVYDRALEAVCGFVPEISDLGASVTDTQIQKIMDHVQRDHPELFWFQHGTTFYYDTATHIVNRLEFRYCLTPEEAKARQAQIDGALKSFLSSVTESMSDYEVTLRIYENIIKLVDYDTLGLERQKKLDPQHEGPDDLRSIYGVFVNKKAVCAGYAKATQYLLNRFGIECTYATSDTHAWNLLKLEGDYYHLDTTWGDSSDTKKDKPQNDSISYDCFCITTEELSRLDSHTPEEIYPLPECTATKCNYHRRHGLFFETYDFDRVRSIVCESVAAGRLDIHLKFATAAVYAQAKRELLDGSKFREAIQYANLKGTARVDTGYSYAYSDNKWTMTIHLRKL